MPIQPLDIFSFFDVQRFVQAGSADLANFYHISNSKSEKALYPAMGRRHVNFRGDVKLLFDSHPRAIYTSIDFLYVIVGTRVFQIDKFYNQTQLSENVSLTGNIWFSYLTVSSTVYCMLTDESNIYVITESPNAVVTMTKCTDSNAPQNPAFVTTFGNRFIVSELNSSTFYLSQINLGGVPLPAANTWFSYGSPAAPLFAQASGVIQQLAVLHNQLYIFTDFSVDIWANIPTVIQVPGDEQPYIFPFKLNTAYNWDFGLEDPHSLDVGFGMMCWLGKNKNGLVTFLVSNGQQPQIISTQAISVLLEAQKIENGLSPFLSGNAEGFLYKWENTIFYRVSAGKFLDFGELDLYNSKNCLEFNFNSKNWHRLIELNGERSRVQKHVYFNQQHLVTVEDQTALFEMRGDIYSNQLQNADDPSKFDFYPVRQEIVTKQIYQPDYSEFITDYVEIDFVFGDSEIDKSDAPFGSAVYLTDEDGNFLVTDESTADTQTVILAEGSNATTELDQHYNKQFRPHIELSYSDDGGVNFSSADVREFASVGVYRWRMRWYQLGASRNRVYKLICVSSSPIVILGAVHNIRRASGGAN